MVSVDVVVHTANFACACLADVCLRQQEQQHNVNSVIVRYHEVVTCLVYAWMRVLVCVRRYVCVCVC